MSNFESLPGNNSDSDRKPVLFSDVDSELTSFPEDEEDTTDFCIFENNHPNDNLTEESNIDFNLTEDNEISGSENIKNKPRFGFYSPKMRVPLSNTTFSIEGSISPIQFENSTTENNELILNEILFDKDPDFLSDDGDVTELADWSSSLSLDSIDTTLDIESKSPLPNINEIDIEARSLNDNSPVDIGTTVSSLTSITSNTDKEEEEEEEGAEPIVEEVEEFNEETQIQHHQNRPLNLKTGIDLSNPNMQDRAGFTQLIRCAKNGDFENCCKLLKANANLHICDNGGWTSLHIACSQKYSDIVELMISHGANVNARTNTGSTPLHEAASSGCEKSVRALLEAGANVNSRNKKGKSAIDLCSNSECLELMQQRLIDVYSRNYQDDSGRTELHYACLRNDVDEAIDLIEGGADVNIQDKDGNAPLHICSDLDHSEILKYLLSHGALIDAKDKNGNTPLHLACQSNNMTIVDLLITDKADASIRNNSDLTPHLLTSNEVIQQACKSHIIDYCNNINGFDILLKPGKSEIQFNGKKNGVILREKTKVKKRKLTQKSLSKYMQNEEASINTTNTSTPSPLSQNDKRRKRLLSISLEHPQENITIQQVNVYSQTESDTTNTLSSNSITNRKVKLSEEEKIALKKALGFIPLYSVLLPDHLDKGFMILDYQLQHFLPIFNRQNYFVELYPTIFRLSLNQYYKERMWPIMEKMIYANTTPDMPKNNRQGPKDFFKKRLNFVRLDDVVKIIQKDYPLYALVLDIVAYDIQWNPITGDPGPKMPGDDGFPPSRTRKKIKGGSPFSTISPCELDIGYFGTPRYIYNVKEFLKKHPKVNPCPHLSLEQGAYYYITRQQPKP